MFGTTNGPQQANPQDILARILGIPQQGQPIPTGAPSAGSPMAPTMQPPVVQGGIGQGQVPQYPAQSGAPKPVSSPLGKIWGRK